MTIHVEWFADGADDCPLVLLHGVDPAAVDRLRASVVGLADRRLARVAVHELPGFASVAACRLFLSRGDADFGIRRPAEGRDFDCVATTSTWRDVGDRLEPFTSPTPSAGFQYLDEHGAVRLILSTARGW